MLYFKACPRCHGDLHVTSDMYGSYKQCLQCGHMIDLDQETEKVTGSKTVNKASARERSSEAA